LENFQNHYLIYQGAEALETAADLLRLVADDETGAHERRDSLAEDPFII
jgi:hypothetical protein